MVRWFLRNKSGPQSKKTFLLKIFEIKGTPNFIASSESSFSHIFSKTSYQNRMFTIFHVKQPLFLRIFFTQNTIFFSIFERVLTLRYYIVRSHSNDWYLFRYRLKEGIHSKLRVIWSLLSIILWGCNSLTLEDMFGEKAREN